MVIVHQTDVHGWIAGHAHNESDKMMFGDYLTMAQALTASSASPNASRAARLSRTAKSGYERRFTHLHAGTGDVGTDVLFGSSGDMVDGTGLSDLTKPRGSFIFQAQAAVYKSLSALGDTFNAWQTAGNHDVTYPDTVNTLADSYAPKLDGHYITTNTRYGTAPDSPLLGAPFATYVTPVHNKRVLLLGFIFNFTQHSNNTQIIAPSDAVNTPWFKEAMAVPDVDFIMVMNHIDPQGQADQLDAIFKGIRASHPSTPMVLLTGHAHQEYMGFLDDNCFVIESGSYFLELGIIEFDLDNFANTVGAEWVLTSADVFADLAGMETWNLSPEGAALNHKIDAEFASLGLNRTIGCAPQTYIVDKQLNASDSFFSLYLNKMLPELLFTPAKSYIPQEQFFVMNTATFRSDMNKGLVVYNDVLCTAPFASVMYYLTPAVNGTFLKKLLQNLPVDPLMDGLVEEHAHLAPRAITMTDEKDGHDLPYWVWTESTVNPTADYSIACADYDCVASIMPTLATLDSSRTYSMNLYQSHSNDTGIVMDYILKEWQC
jgi:2',3'-cyclic-nucleotide 2'-phosphodiesterase (5'-nucleotidase family)